MAKPIAVVLSGCGVFDGAEIHEATLTLLHLDLQGASYQCLAPNIEQAHVVNHLTGEVAEGESRNVLVEAARIARGEIKALDAVSPDDFSAVVLPGGFGAAKNLCDFAFKGPEMVVNSEVEAFVKAFADQGKPVCLMCIAPAMAPKLFPEGVKSTIGTDEGTASAVEAMGAEHVNCQVDEVCVDEAHNLITTPAYMLAGSIAEANSGIEKAISTLLRRLN